MIYKSLQSKLPQLRPSAPLRPSPRNMKVKIDVKLCWTHKKETTWASVAAPRCGAAGLNQAG